MTMIAALIFPDRALLVADSVCCYPGGAIVVGEDGHAFEDHKLIELPGGVVLTLLGSLSLRHYAAADIRELHGFDAVLEHLPAVLRAGAARLGERVDGAPLGAGGNTAVLAGWSAAKGQMAMAALRAGNNFVPEFYGPGCFWRNPESPGADPYAAPADRNALVDWAHGCVRGLRVLDPRVPIGGKLRLAEVTRAGCSLSVAGDLGLPSLAAMALSAALVGCGGGAPEDMFAEQLSTNAATETMVASSASGSVTSTSGLTPSHINALSWVNTTDGNVTAHIDHSVVGWHTTAGGGTGRSFFEFAYTLVLISGQNIPSPNNRADGTESNFSALQEVVVPAGATLNVDMWAAADRVSGTSVTCNWRYATSRVALIKR